MNEVQNFKYKLVTVCYQGNTGGYGWEPFHSGNGFVNEQIVGKVATIAIFACEMAVIIFNRKLPIQSTHHCKDGSVLLFVNVWIFCGTLSNLATSNR